MLSSEPQEDASLPRLMNHESTEPIVEIEVKPHDELDKSLGIFTDAKPPKGFSIEISPDPEPSDSVITRIMSLGPAEQYELMLHIVNQGNQAANVTVRPL